MNSLAEQANGKDDGATKPSNPKDIIGSRKIPLDIVPDTIAVLAAPAFLEGALKYGRYNWRICGVRASIYYSALKRHIKKWWNGQDEDPITRVHHLSNALACIAILLDAELYGKLEDDRPPCPDPDAMAKLIDEMEDRVKYLKALFAKENPRQYTIADTLAPPTFTNEQLQYGCVKAIENFLAADAAVVPTGTTLGVHSSPGMQPLKRRCCQTNHVEPHAPNCGT